MTPDPGRAALNARQYWLQFPVTAYFDKPGTIIAGHLLEHLVVKTADGPMPRLKLQTDKGRVVIVNVSQERLRAALVLREPAVGEYLTITYHGEATDEKGRPIAAKGMSPAKGFTVEVRRPEMPAQDRTGPDRGAPGTETENGPAPAEQATS